METFFFPDIPEDQLKPVLHYKELLGLFCIAIYMLSIHSTTCIQTTTNYVISSSLKLHIKTLIISRNALMFFDTKF